MISMTVALRRLRALLGITSPTRMSGPGSMTVATVTAALIEVPVTVHTDPMGTAVAGFAMRIEEMPEPDETAIADRAPVVIAYPAAPVASSLELPIVADRMLSARLASVAKLNTRSGRIPRVAPLTDASQPPRPSARIGAKKQRCAASGPRVLKRAAPSPSAAIIPFPTGEALAAAKANRQTKAA